MASGYSVRSMDSGEVGRRVLKVGVAAVAGLAVTVGRKASRS
jgi:hypothetical protein